MTRSNQRTGRAFLAAALAFVLLAAPAAWASPGGLADPGGWLDRVWSELVAWASPSESAAGIEPGGLPAPTETWDPEPIDPTTTDASTEDDDRGPTMDPDG